MNPWPKTLRGRFLALTFLGVLLPLALVGVWLAHTARGSAEAAVRTRLETSVASVAQTIAYRWIDQRSALHALAADERVRRAARDGGSVVIPPGDPAWRPLEGLVESATIRDSGAGLSQEVTVPVDREPSDPLAATLPVSIPVHDALLGGRIGTLDVRLRLARLLPSGFWSVGIGGGMVALFDADDEPLLPSPLDLDLLQAPRFGWNGEQWIAVQQRLYEPPLRIAAAAPLGPVSGPLAGAARRGLVALIGVSVLALLAITVVSARLTRSLEALASVSDAVSRGELDASIPETGSVEVHRVSRAFNAMTRSLRDLLRIVARQRSAAAVGEFAGSLAHEIRNPLTAVRLDLEDARDQLTDPAATALLERALVQIDRLDSTVRGTLRLAASGTIELALIDLNEPVRAALHAAQPSVREHGVSMEHTLGTDAMLVQGNAAAIEQLVLNLVLNGIEAAGAGGNVRVSVGLANGSARVDVEDNGPGLPADDLARAEEPFFTTKSGGTGLGLAVARRIADAHGGELHLDSDVTGTRATFRLPAAQE